MIEIKITGTLINYYFHCKRQCWLLGNRINLEDNSEDVRIGKVLHEIKLDGNHDKELSIDNVKVDKITKDYLVEIKKSDSDVDAARWQVLLYLKIIKNKGIEKKGRIEFIEKNKTNKKTIIVELDESSESELEEIEKEISNLVYKSKIPEPVLKRGCKKCAYYEYCFI